MVFGTEQRLSLNKSSGREIPANTTRRYCKNGPKKVQGYIKLQIPAGKATPAPPVGPALGQHGVNIVEIYKTVQRKNSRSGRPYHSCCDHSFTMTEASAS